MLEKIFGHSHKNVKFNYDYILDGIYIGNNQCCHLGLDLMLQKEGIYADISLEESEIDQPNGVQTFLWIPTKDHCAPSTEQILLGVEMIDKLVKLNKKIYIHCKNGHGRAPTLLIAYLITKRSMNYQEALKLVKTARPAMHLHQTQIDFLQEIK